MALSGNEPWVGVFLAFLIYYAVLFLLSFNRVPRNPAIQLQPLVG